MADVIDIQAFKEHYEKTHCEDCGKPITYGAFCQECSDQIVADQEADEAMEVRRLEAERNA